MRHAVTLTLAPVTPPIRSPVPQEWTLVISRPLLVNQWLRAIGINGMGRCMEMDDMDGWAHGVHAWKYVYIYKYGMDEWDG